MTGKNKLPAQKTAALLLDQRAVSVDYEFAQPRGVETEDYRTKRE